LEELISDFDEENFSLDEDIRVIYIVISVKAWEGEVVDKKRNRPSYEVLYKV
jgi:hypothetical protein